MKAGYDYSSKPVNSKNNAKKGFGHNSKRGVPRKKIQIESSEVNDNNFPKLHCLPIEVIGEKLYNLQSYPPSEASVGILTYLNKNDSEIPSSGFSCILKHRFSDFNVNEIDPEGNVAYLTDSELPSCDVKPSLSETLEKMKYPIYDDLDDNIKKWITPTFWSHLLVLAKKICVPGELEKIGYKNEIGNVDVTGSEKHERKELHSWFKSQFPFVISEGATEQSNNPQKKCITLQYAKMDQFRTSESDMWIRTWPRDRQEKFLHFTLYKQGYEQVEILNTLTKSLIGNRYSGKHGKKDFKTSKYCFKHAGNKDRRARTCQRLSIKHVMAVSVKDAVNRINEKLRSRFPEAKDKVAVSNFVYKNNSINIGDLKGNRFTLVLRNFHINQSMDGKEPLKLEKINDDELEKKVDNAMYSLTTKGFINYFGLQRFGNNAFPNTADVGLEMIKQNWMKVVELILYPRNKDRALMKRARAHWWMYRDARYAYNIVKHDEVNSLEKILLKGLAESNENDIVGALCRLPRQSLMLYMHAYQAQVWNKVVTRRLEMFGDKVLIGDIVQKPNEVQGNLNVKLELESNQGETIEETELLEHAEDEETVYEKMSLNRLELKKRELSYVTEETINDFMLENVYMILPGHGVSYPKNQELEQLYLDVMKEDGLLEGFPDLVNVTSKNFSLDGDYRKIVGKPENVEYQLTRYTYPNDHLLNKSLSGSQLKDHVIASNQGPYLALVIAMSLQSSEYATMAVREITRMDTGVTHQSMLTKQHIEKCSSNASGTKRCADEIESDKLENEYKLLKTEKKEQNE